MVKLVVKKSVVKGSGIGRVNAQVLKDLDAKAEDYIVVSTDEKIILVKAVPDSTIRKNEISLREKDCTKLGIEEGAEIEAYHHRTFAEITTEKIEKLKKMGAAGKEKLNKWLERRKLLRRAEK